jgi:predicted NAD/FAD-binding protein
MNIAVVGSGISGLSAAWRLSEWAKVTVFESETRLGGHTHTQTVAIDGISCPVDTGFIVFNHRTYPGLKAWFELLEVQTVASDMSFSASLNQGALEWCGSSLNSVFAQRRNLVSPKFWGMLADIIRFNREAPRYAERIRAQTVPELSLGAFLSQQGYGPLFLEAYLLPMAGAIWSCPTEEMRAFPMETFTRFCENHGLLQIADRPQWYSVRGGSQCYISRLQQLSKEQGRAIHWRTGHSVAAVEPQANSNGGGLPCVRVSGQAQGQDRFSEVFDAVVLACHSDQAAAMLTNDLAGLRSVARAIRYQKNTAFLHRDQRLMPRRQAAWASWNYLHDTRAQNGRQPVSVTYWMNRLQDLPVRSPVLVSLNPTRPPEDRQTFNVMEYAHPVFDGPASVAQQALPQHQGEGAVWLAGAWTRYGFHEDGFQSGRQAADDIFKKFAPLGVGQAYAQAA